MPSAECVARPGGRASWGYVRAAQQGDTDAVARLYERYHRDIYAYLLTRTRQVPVAEDLTSETFARVVRKIGSVREESDSVRAWIMVIARNLALDHHKSMRTRVEVLTDQPIDARGSADSAEHAVVRHEIRDVVRAGLRALTSDQRTCLFWRFYCGFSVARTAAAMGRNPGAVRALQYRAIRELGALL